MTDRPASPALPTSGGSYVRQGDGSLKPAPAAKPAPPAKPANPET